jgi:hypothetical protein
MDLIAALRALRRQWLVTCFLLLVTLAGVAGLTFKLPSTYQAQSTTVLLPSRAASQPNGYNPYLSFDGSLTNTAYLLSVEVTGPASQKVFAAEGDTGSYTVGLSPDTDGPVLITMVTAPSKSDAERTLQTVTAALGNDILELQVAKHIRPSDQIGFEVVAMNSQATLLFSKKVKTVGMALALGLFVTISVPVLIDNSRLRRKQERRAAMTKIPEHWTSESDGGVHRPPFHERQAHSQAQDEPTLAGAHRSRQRAE